ncbi:MAG: FliG C-terminal domain-containing protein [Pseudomonadota bacterium]
MSVDSPIRASAPPYGAAAAAHLLRAVGASSRGVLAQLTPEETRAIQAQMDHLSPDEIGAQAAALEAFLLESAHGQADEAADAAPSIWTRINQSHAPLLLAIASKESPRVAAWVLRQLKVDVAVIVVRGLDEAASAQILKHMLGEDLPMPGVPELIEARIQATVERLADGPAKDARAHLAEIFDGLDDGAETRLLSQLEDAAPGASQDIRSQMFLFDDLARLGPAALQTLLSKVARDTLVLALKDAPPAIENAIFSNVTRRAGAVIREELAAAGPVRRSQIDGARRELTAAARALIASGDIHTGRPVDDDELVE